MLDYKKAANYRPGKMDFEKINSRVPSQEYKDNWDRIFGKKEEEKKDDSSVPDRQSTEQSNT